ncbi:uncharacterized protein LOC100370384 [Saccoglossus kowalevskii]|uniref:Uncharacterized protein LOC100370384 n=1 Tax=Saccoglossus kowalevskii TaxID=10224 RepID=A0ABM0GYJ5_SACKO|nr:PREDICTED: uncharacterized protein LOC100370384 [Saccoglossus kowalevskii]
MRLVLPLLAVLVVNFSSSVLLSAAEDLTSNDCLIDKAFIKAREGFRVNGYLPEDEDGNIHENSGVTIGNGVDLGSKNANYFRDMGVPETIITKFTPYFGLRGTAAQIKLDEIPLHLEEDEATDLSRRVMDKEITDVRRAYDNKVTEIGNTNLKKYDELTVAQRTVIASVYFQYGSPGRFPTFWGHVTNQRWNDAIAELRDFGDDFGTRRNLEADLLEEDSGKTNLCSSPDTSPSSDASPGPSPDSDLASNDCLIDKAFIKAREGFRVNGYLPEDEDGNIHENSGVTIGNGVDLGSKNANYFRDMGVPETIITKFTPYFGLRGTAAQNKLDEIPLHLEEDEATDLSRRVMDKEIIDVRRAYDNKVTEIGNTNLKKFDELTVAQRTVIASVYFQYGSPGRFPKFWGYVTNQRWNDAIAELRDFGDDFGTRRNLEADLLEEDSGKTNLCSSPDPSPSPDASPDPTSDPSPDSGVAVVSQDCLIDKSFIRAREGFRMDGYVPKDKHGNVHANSGVTIGSGVDLGSKNAKYFRDMDVPKTIITKFTPYFGLRGTAAQNKLNERGLHLEKDEATQLSNRVMDKEIDDVRRAYDNKVAEIGNRNLKKYDELTVAQRTVIASVYFQYGSPGRFPTFWGHVTNQRWNDAISELRDFKDDFPTRRNLEADLLENDSGETTLCSDYIGCYKDDASLPALIHKSTSSSITSVDTCASYCRARAYPYAGLQYTSSQLSCRCGESYAQYGTANDPTECSHECRYSIRGTLCGGNLRNSVYRTGYIGCVDKSHSSLNYETFSSDRMYPHHCVALCSKKGYEYAGLTQGDTCSCGNGQQQSNMVPRSDCGTRCSGRGSDVCGGVNKVAVLRTGIALSCLEMADNGDCEFFKCFKDRHSICPSSLDITSVLHDRCKSLPDGFRQSIFRCVGLKMLDEYKHIPQVYSSTKCYNLYIDGQNHYSSCVQPPISNRLRRDASTGSLYEHLKNAENLEAYKASIDQLLSTVNQDPQSATLKFLQQEVEKLTLYFHLGNFHDLDGILEAMKTSVRQRLLEGVSSTPPTLSGDSSCEELATFGDCDFFDCFENRYTCGPDGFALSFGKVFCEQENKYKMYLKNSGGTSMGNVQTCVMNAMLTEYRKNSSSCKDIEFNMLDAYRGCYDQYFDCDFVRDNQFQLTNIYALPQLSSTTLQDVAKSLVVTTLCHNHGSTLYSIIDNVKFLTN